MIRLGNCLRVPRWALLALALGGRTVPLSQLTSGSIESRRLLDAELARIDPRRRDTDSDVNAPEHDTSEPDGQLGRRTRARRLSASRAVEQLHLLPPS